MSEASSAELIAAALASVDGRVAAQIEAAKQRRERDRQQRQQFTAARNAGIGYRNAAKLRHLAHAETGQRDDRTSSPANRSGIATVRGPHGAVVTETVTAVGQKPTTDGQRPTVAPVIPTEADDRVPTRNSVTTSQPDQWRWSSSSLTRARGGGHAGTPE